MNKQWLLVIIAALFEVIWVVGLKNANQLFEWIITFISITISFIVLIYSSKKLPASTVYAVFVGLGTGGTIVSEMIWFHEPFQWLKIGLIVLLLTGIIGLKLVTHEQPNEQAKGRESS